MGRDFLHHRPCCLGAGAHALVLLLHFVPHHFPTASCNLRLDTAAGATGALRYDCVPHAMGGRMASVDPVTADDARAVGTQDAIASDAAGSNSVRTSASDRDGTAADDGTAAGAGEGGDTEECDGASRADAYAWLGPLHDMALAETRREGQHMAYSSCVQAKGDAEHCLGQLNNQLHLLHHALAVSRAMQRTLVIPPFLWMAHQNAPTQHWLPAGHIIDLCALRRHHPAVELHSFARQLNRSGATLPHVLTPPYLVPPDDPAYSGAFFTRRGLRTRRPRLITPFSEVVQATSGRGEQPFEPDEGVGYWRAAALHAGAQQQELASLLSESPLSEAEAEGRGRAGPPSAFGRVSESTVTSALTRHASTLLQWRELARSHPELVGAPLLSHADRRADVADVIAFDYAPSFNFQLDCFAFDAELRASHRATPFAPRLHALARQARSELFPDGQRYLAAHVRRDGYDRYCAGDGGALRGSVFRGRRFGVLVTPEMCFPSIEQIAASLALLLERHQLTAVLLATNEQDESQLDRLQRQLDRLQRQVAFRRWRPPPSVPPELVPLIELLLCREAEAFVGTFPSTFSTTILAQRDVRGANRSTTSFFGALDFFL